MAFVLITDAKKALELYRAGLLWEEWLGDRDAAARANLGLDIHAAYGWDETCLVEKIKDSTTFWRFYLFLED